MPNVDVKRGLVPVRYASGSPYMGACNKYAVQATNANPIFQGDPVVLTGEGVGAYAGVARATDGAVTFLGVVVGFEPTEDREQLGYLPATTAGIVHVADQSDLEYEIQANGAVVAAQIGLNAGLALTNGDTVYRSSNVELDIATAAITATLPVQIVGAMDREDNDPYDAGGNAKLRVRKANGEAGI